VATSNTEAVAAALRPHLVAADSGELLGCSCLRLQVRPQLFLFMCLHQYLCMCLHVFVHLCPPRCSICLQSTTASCCAGGISAGVQLNEPYYRVV
jgi:hypothetical protein